MFRNRVRPVLGFLCLFGFFAAIGSLRTGTVLSAEDAAAPPHTSVHLEELTWPEVVGALQRGRSVAIVPTGGLEQNGPHMVLGKHNYVVRYAAGEIAARLGNALVAPVVGYVPQGSIEPPDGHMRFPGTISVSRDTFEAILDATARSLRAHGFTLICFLGDSGGNQASQAAVAKRLNAAWAGSGVQVVHVGDYYGANGQLEWLRGEGETEASIGRHAGIRDTSELMHIRPSGVRRDRLARSPGPARHRDGVSGDPQRASAARGGILIELKIDAAVRQIRALGNDG